MNMFNELKSNEPNSKINLEKILLVVTKQ